MSDARRFGVVLEAIERGERDSRFLDGRNFDVMYWRRAKQALSMIRRNYEIVESERDAFEAVVGV